MRAVIESLLFRALVLATLIFAATLFATHQPVNGGLAKVEQPHTDQQVRHEETERTVLGVGAEGWTAIFTGILAVFTMGLAGITYWLFRVTRTGIAEQAELTRASTQVAEQALTGLDRPYIFLVISGQNIPTGATFGSFQSERLIGVEFAYRNFGKTPAILKSFGFMPMLRERGTPRRSTQESFVNSEIINAIGAHVSGGGQMTPTLRSVLSRSPDESGLMSQLPPAFLKELRAQQAAQENVPVAISLHDRITYADMLGNEYVLSVVFEFTGTTFVTVENEERKIEARQ